DQAAAAGEAKSSHQSSVLRRRLRNGVSRIEDTRSASGGVMLEIDLMADWLVVLSALLGGGVAAGVLFYVVGRWVERLTAGAAGRWRIGIRRSPPRSWRRAPGSNKSPA